MVSQANTFHFLQKPVSQLEIYNTTLKKKLKCLKKAFELYLQLYIFLVTLNDISGKEKRKKKTSLTFSKNPQSLHII